MKVNKKELKKSQVELEVIVPWKDLEKKLHQGAENLSKHVKIDGFRPGKVPFEVLKERLGEMAIINEAAQIVLGKTLAKAIKEAGLKESELLGYPDVNIIKLAPNNDFIYKIIVTLVPKVELAPYKNLNIKKREIKVKEEEVEKIIKEWQEVRATEVIANREIKKGDKVIVDIDMFLNKVPIEGGQSKDTAVIVGKNYIIPGFDKHLIGARKGDEKKFQLPYPEDFHLKNLAGKLVDFVVKIKEVYERQLPKVDDKFAISFGFKDVFEMKKYIRDAVQKQKEREAREAIEREIMEAIIKKSKFGDFPDSLVNTEVNEMINELKTGVERQGGNFDDYLKSINKTRDQLMLDLVPEAIKRIKAALVLREISKKENIKIFEKEIEEQIELIRNQARSEKEKEHINSPSFRDHLANALLSRKILEKLYEWNVESKDKKEKK